jgi:hypothetical protein
VRRRVGGGCRLRRRRVRDGGTSRRQELGVGTEPGLASSERVGLRVGPSGQCNGNGTGRGVGSARFVAAVKPAASVSVPGALRFAVSVRGPRLCGARYAVPDGDTSSVAYWRMCSVGVSL